MLIREKYLSKIRGFYDVDLIKIIMGIRRSGKSILLKQIMEEIKNEGVNNDQILYINFEDVEYAFINDYLVLNDYVKSKINKKKKNYLFFDEIQNVEKWQKTINSFKATMGDNVSMFITGSNSDLLSGELATLLTGRYVSFNIYPFTFSEVYEYYKKDDKNISKDDLFMDYFYYGGFPQRFTLNNVEEIKTYLFDIYNSIIVKDIILRYNIKDLDLFNKVLEYIITTPSQTFSVDSLIKYFLSENRVVSKITIYNYLDYMTRAMLINKTDRYDVRGKRILNGKYKYYITDLGLTQIKSVGKRIQNGAYLENIVFNELLSRGYDVKVGTLDNGEVDFIATRFEEKIYIQVAYLLSSEEVIEREFGAYKNIVDNYPKYVISTDKFNMSQDGIIHKNIIDWLLDK